MKRRFPAVLQYLTVCLLATGCASAVPIACPTTGSFETLVGTNTDGGCFVGDKLFSEFTYSSAAGASSGLQPDQLTYTTVVNAPVAIGFQFSGPIGTIPNPSMTISIGWIVTGPAIRSVHLGFTGSFFGNSSARVDETYCKGGAVEGCEPANTGNLSVFTDQSGTQLVDQIQFAPVGILGVEKTITVTSSGGASFANISEILQTVDQVPSVPEPATTLVVSSGLLALCAVRRRRA